MSTETSARQVEEVKKRHWLQREERCGSEVPPETALAHVEASLGLLALLFPSALVGLEGPLPLLGALHLVFLCARTERLRHDQLHYRGLNVYRSASICETIS